MNIFHRYVCCIISGVSLLTTAHTVYTVWTYGLYGRMDWYQNNGLVCICSLVALLTVFKR